MAQNNTGLGLIKTTIERVQNKKSLFNSALKKLVNSTEEELDDFLKRKIEPTVNESILRLVSPMGGLIINALDGSRLIYEAKKTFKSFLDNDFVNWGINNPGIATPKTLIQVREMIGDGKFMDIFRALPGTWNQKWVSQNQVIEFCETLPEWLRQEVYATFFLIKKDENKPIDENNPEDNLVVVSVGVLSDGLGVGVYRLGHDDVWHGEYRHRVVSPQLPIPLAE
jgi:hypothetical protein